MKNIKLSKTIAFSMSFLFLWAGLLSTASAEDIKEGCIASNNGLNVRTEASLKAKIVSVLKNGTKVKLLDEINGWYKITAGSGYGYINKEFVKLNSPKENASGMENEVSSGTSASSDGNTVQPQNEVFDETKSISGTVMSGNGLNLREGATVNSKILELLKSGTQVEVLGKTNDWCKVKVSNLTGYVAKQYLKLDTKEEQTSLESTSTAFAKSKPGKGIVLTNNGLNLRKEANLKSKVIAMLKPNSIVNIIEENGDWYKLKFEKLEGYAFKKFIKLE